MHSVQLAVAVMVTVFVIARRMDLLVCVPLGVVGRPALLILFEGCVVWGLAPHLQQHEEQF